MGTECSISVFDAISSPTQSVIRGLIFNCKFLGIAGVVNASRHLINLYRKRPKNLKSWLIHKDLKIDQNMIPTSKGVYFIDFGSSVITKNYFLTDVVELATNHQTYEVDFHLIEKFLERLDIKADISFIRSQVYLLLLRRYLHFPEIDRKNKEKMYNVKKFLRNLDSNILKIKA